MPSYNFRVNGFARTVDSPDPDQPLLYVLRKFGLTAAKYGCGLGQCGACNVLIDGRAVQSCSMPIAAVAGQIDHDARGAWIDVGAASGAGRLHQGTGAAMRLLHERHDYERGRAVGEQAEAYRSGNSFGPRRKPVPLRHPCPGRARGDRGIGAGRLT